MFTQHRTLLTACTKLLTDNKKAFIFFPILILFIGFSFNANAGEVFNDNFESGLGNWTLYGFPSPNTVSDGTNVLNINPDNSHDSGVISNASFSAATGNLKIEFKSKCSITTCGVMEGHGCLDAGFLAKCYSWGTNNEEVCTGGMNTDVRALVGYTKKFAGFENTFTFTQSTTTPLNIVGSFGAWCDSAWHTHKLIIKQSGGAEYYVDGVLQTAIADNVSGFSGKLAFAGWGSGGFYYFDDVVVTLGLSVSVSGAPVSWQNSNATASVSCTDSCDIATYKLKTYTSNPGSCSTTYSDYTLTSPQTISSYSWVCAAAKDTASNEGYSNPVEFKVEQAAPTVTINSPAASAWQIANFTFNVTNGDTGGSGLNSCEYRVLSNGSETKPWTVYTCAAGPAITAGAGQDCRDEGTDKCEVQVKATDVAGNTSTSQTRTFSIDFSPPTADITGAPANWQNTDAAAGVNCAEIAGSGCDTATYRLRQQTAACSTNYSDYTLMPPQTVSSHAFYCAAVKDTAGNVGFTATAVEFKIDKSPPTADVTGAPANWQNTDATAGVNCADTGDSNCDSTASKLREQTGACSTNEADYTLTSPITVSSDKFYCAAAKDNAGNSVFTSTAVEFKVDKAVPTSSVTPLSQYQGSETFTVSWQGTDDGSVIKNYDVQVKDNVSDTWADWQTQTTQTSAQYTGVNGKMYSFRSRAYDNAGNIEDYTAQADASTTIDTSLLSAPAVTDSGAYTNDATQLTASWNAVSGAAKYYYAIGTTAYGTDVVNWTDNGASASVTKTGLTLTHNVTYYVSVKAQNFSGADGAAGTSDGIKVDTVKPSSSVSTLSQYQGSETFTVSWQGTDDGSVIKNYDVQVKDNVSNTWADWQTQTTQTSAQYTGVNGKMYSFRSRAEDNAGNVEDYTAQADASTTIDTSLLPAPAVTDSGDYTNDATQLTASWNVISGAAKYYYAIGTTAYGTDVINWTDNGASASVTKTGLTLTHNVTYYVSVKAQNFSGADGTAGTSDGIKVDTTPPSTPVVTDEGSTTQDPAKLTFTIAAKDEESGISEYQYAIGTAANFESEAPFTSTTSTRVTHAGLNLKENETYFISVKAKNNASSISEAGKSDGITYKVRLSKITFNSSHASIIIESTDKKAVTYTLINDGNLPVHFISESTVYVLPNREQVELPAIVDISLPVGNSVTLNRDIVLGQGILNETLAGSFTGAMTLKRIFRGTDENGEIEITHLLPVEITLKPQEIYEVKSITVDLPVKNILKDKELTATVGVNATGLGGQAGFEIWINGVPWQRANVPVQGQNKLTYFDTPPLPTSQSGTYEVVVKSSAPNVYASSPIVYKVGDAPMEIPLKNFVLRPTQTTITPQEDMLVLKGEGDIDMLPFNVKTVKVETEGLKVRDNKFVDGKITYTPATPAMTTINGMELKITSFEFTPDSSTVNVTFQHPYLPEDNSFKLEIDKEGFIPDKKAVFEFPQPKVVEIGQTKMEFLKGNIYISPSKNIIMTLFSKEKSSVALFPGLNVTVEGMRLEF